jgi:hypothetical protein
MYTYEVTSNPPMCKILKDGSMIDHSGPWESEEAAAAWAELFVTKCNSGYNPFSGA